MRNPKLTVCIPSYNCARFLSAAIESVLGQTFTDFELLIMDDCSQDESREIITRYASMDSRIVTRFHDNNIGMVNNWNACLRAARGEYIKYLFGDDLLASKDALLRMVSLLDADQTISLVASARNIINEASEIVYVASSLSADTLIRGTVVINRCLFTQKNLIGEPSVVMIRKTQAVRGFDSRYSQFVDLEMWFHLLEQGKYCNIGVPLASFRIHADQQTKKNVRDLVHVDEMIALMNEYGGRPYVTLGLMTRIFLQYHQVYRIWKAYKNGKINRIDAELKISRYYPLRKFLALLPLFKIMSPVWKLKCFIGTLASKCGQ